MWSLYTLRAEQEKRFLTIVTRCRAVTKADYNTHIRVCYREARREWSVVQIFWHGVFAVLVNIKSGWRSSRKFYGVQGRAFLGLGLVLLYLYITSISKRSVIKSPITQQGRTIKIYMMLNSWVKHILHCCLLATFILVFEFVSGGLHWGPRDQNQLDPWVQYGFVGALTLYLLRTLTFLSFPQVLFNFIGLTIYNAFPDKVCLKGSPLLAPFICIRVVTRGDYPQLVKTNVDKNLNKCIDAGLENFQIEVVSDKPIGLAAHRRIREVVVPPNYRTTSGALFKARALQYCLENSVNELADHDWIVHLDEETLLTDNSIRGILNFVLDGKHQFGQGLITYANEDVVNWITTLADSFRVADDMGKLRLQFTMFHKPLFSMKGSYVVTQAGAERQVSFNNGLDGSVAEDCFFAMKAFSQGYSFNFIDGEMWEKSPFTLWDFVQQRKRWLQGILLVVHSKAIPVKKKLLLAISCYSWVTMPLSTSNIVLAGLCPITCPPAMDFLCAFIGAVNIYMYIFGVVKSFSLYRFGVARFMLFICGALMTIPFNLIIENVAVIWGLFGKKHKFYVVNKEFKPLTV